VNAAAIGVLCGISRPRRKKAPPPSAKKLEVAPPAPKQPAPSASAVVLTKADEGEVGW
jgi:hypothetical protein